LLSAQWVVANPFCGLIEHLNAFMAVTNKTTVWIRQVSVGSMSCESCACRSGLGIIRTSLALPPGLRVACKYFRSQ